MIQTKKYICICICILYLYDTNCRVLLAGTWCPHLSHLKASSLNPHPPKSSLSSSLKLLLRPFSIISVASYLNSASFYIPKWYQIPTMLFPRHIRSWFLQSYAGGERRDKNGRFWKKGQKNGSLANVPKRSHVINLTCFWPFGAMLRLLRSFSTISDKTWFFASKASPSPLHMTGLWHRMYYTTLVYV